MNLSGILVFLGDGVIVFRIGFGSMQQWVLCLCSQLRKFDKFIDDVMIVVLLMVIVERYDYWLFMQKNGVQKKSFVLLKFLWILLIVCESSSQQFCVSMQFFGKFVVFDVYCRLVRLVVMIGQLGLKLVSGLLVLSVLRLLFVMIIGLVSSLGWFFIVLSVLRYCFLVISVCVLDWLRMKLSFLLLYVVLMGMIIVLIFMILNYIRIEVGLLGSIMVMCVFFWQFCFSRFVVMWFECLCSLWYVSCMLFWKQLIVIWLL